jgi:hypothetical protein
MTTVQMSTAQNMLQFPVTQFPVTQFPTFILKKIFEYTDSLWCFQLTDKDKFVLKINKNLPFICRLEKQLLHRTRYSNCVNDHLYYLIVNSNNNCYEYEAYLNYSIVHYYDFQSNLLKTEYGKDLSYIGVSFIHKCRKCRSKNIVFHEFEEFDQEEEEKYCFHYENDYDNENPIGYDIYYYLCDYDN